MQNAERRALYLPIRPWEGIMTEAIPRGQLIRERDLEQASVGKIEGAKSILIDLSEIKMLTVDAAFEVIDMWIWSLRQYNTKAPIVGVTAKYLDILRTVHAALRDSDNAAYAILPTQEENNSDRLVAIGRLTRKNREDLDRVKNHEPMNPNDKERLKDLRDRGLLLHDEASDSYEYPTLELFDM